MPRDGRCACHERSSGTASWEERSNDPEFEAKKNRILELYAIADGLTDPGPTTRQSSSARRQRRACRRLLPDRREIMSRPLVEVFYFDGCPNHEPALEMVEHTSRDLGIDTDLRLVAVPDIETARRVRFLGSPTIRVEGRDIDPHIRERSAYTLSCRLFQTESGTRGHPDPHWLRDALRRADLSSPPHHGDAYVSLLRLRSELPSSRVLGSPARTHARACAEPGYSSPELPDARGLRDERDRPASSSRRRTQ